MTFFKLNGIRTIDVDKKLILDLHLSNDDFNWVNGAHISNYSKDDNNAVILNYQNDIVSRLKLLKTSIEISDFSFHKPKTLDTLLDI